MERSSSYYNQSSQPQIIIQQEPVRKWSPGIAALLSFLIPGAGQLYKGHVIRGLIWFVITGIGYFLLFVPGLILHTICIISASMGDPYSPRRY
jgi:TM2 domain-containing membrane protein YozV